MHEDLLARAYAAFNARDIDRALAVMHPDVEWPNGMEGGYVLGHGGRIVVDVHQVVRDRSGTVVADQMVRHVYRIEQGLIRHMEIRK